MRVLANLLYALSAATFAGAVAIGLRAGRGWDEAAGGFIALLELLHFAVPLVLASGIFLSLGVAARFAGDRQRAELRGDFKLPPDRERRGMLVLRLAVLVTLLGAGAVAWKLGAMILAGEAGGPLQLLDLFTATMRPLLAGALLAAAGTALRRPAPG